MNFVNLFTACLLSVVYISKSWAVPLELGCNFAVDVDSLQLPLLTNEKGLMYPKYDAWNDKWNIRLDSGATFKAACPGNHFKSMGSDKINQLAFQCVAGSLLKSSRGFHSFGDIACAADLKEVITRDGLCYNNYTNVKIEFADANPPYTLITVCHNEELDETIFSKHELDGENLHNSQPVGSRPSFRPGDFYKTLVSADTCYTQAQQTTTVAELVGSRQLAEHYVQPSKNLFMARGHFTPNGDPIYAFQKRATFYFINASPQWQTINGGNFERLESTIRTLAGSMKAKFNIWTGSYGIMKLNDVNNNPVEIWLGKDKNGTYVKKLPVAHLTWKVIHNQKHNNAIAVIQINNPWLANVRPEDILCPDVCQHVSWISWNPSDIVKGYTYCCDVASFKRAVPYAPDLGNLPLLDYPSKN